MANLPKTAKQVKDQLDSRILKVSEAIAQLCGNAGPGGKYPELCAHHEVLAVAERLSKTVTTLLNISINGASNGSGQVCTCGKAHPPKAPEPKPEPKEPSLMTDEQAQIIADAIAKWKDEKAADEKAKADAEAKAKAEAKARVNKGKAKPKPKPAPEGKPEATPEAEAEAETETVVEFLPEPGDDVVPTSDPPKGEMQMATQGCTGCNLPMFTTDEKKRGTCDWCVGAIQ